MKIFVDYGHGGNDSGAVGGGLYEKNINKLIGERVKHHLERHGQTVLLTRINDENISLDDRVALINKSSCDIGISIHCNSATNKSARGYESFTWGNGTRELTLAKKIHSEVVKSKLCHSDRGLKVEQWKILSPQIPCCLVETGFISNDEDREFILNNIENFAIAYSKGLLSYYEIAWKGESVTTPVEQKYYRVQVGAYSNKSNADGVATELQLKGYPTTVKYY